MKNLVEVRDVILFDGDVLRTDDTRVREGLTPRNRIVPRARTRQRQTREGDVLLRAVGLGILRRRIQQVVDGAMRFNRKIAFLGRSMVRNVELARKLGYLLMSFT